MGAAKTFARSESGIKDWCSLKQALKKEFGRKLSSLEIHRTLGNRKKKSGETLREYLYSLREIGNPIRLDEQSLIEYFIDGISDYKSNKAILYQSRNLDELKENIAIYEKISASDSSGSKGARPKSFLKNVTETKDERRCFKCGDKGHLSSACASAQVKCFKCHGFGHKSFECGQEVKKEKNEDKKGSGGGGNGKSTNNVHTLSDDIIIPSRRIFKDISILDRTISAFVDTGSDICAIRCDSLLILGEFDLKPDVRTLVGIGGRKITTMGNFTVKVGMDEVEMDVTFHVCKEGDILYSVVLGNDIFDEVDLVIDSDGAKFRYKGRSAKVEEVNDTGNDSLMAELQSECGDKLDAQHLVENIELENLIGTYEPTRAEDCSMKMMLNDEIPAAQMPRRMSYTDPILVDEQLVELFKEGVNKPSSSEYAAPMVLAAKIDGTKRLCCDYRRLDETKVRDDFKVVVTDDVIRCSRGVEAFRRLEFDYISSVFRELVTEGSMMIDTNDRVLLSGNEEKEIGMLRGVLKVSELNGLDIEWMKCQFLRGKIDFRGCIVEFLTARLLDGSMIYVLSLRFRAMTYCASFALTMREQNVLPRMSRSDLFLLEIYYETENSIVSGMRCVDVWSRAQCPMIGNSFRYRSVRRARPQDERIREVPMILNNVLNMRICDDFDVGSLLGDLILRRLHELRIRKEEWWIFDRGRVPITAYDGGGLVAIKRTRFGAGMKLEPKFLGPYGVVKELDHGRYEVEKVGDSEGSRKCTTVSEYMKRWGQHSGRM